MSVEQRELTELDDHQVAERIAQLTRSARALRAELPASAAAADAENTDTEFGMRRV